MSLLSSGWLDVADHQMRWVCVSVEARWSCSHEIGASFAILTSRHSHIVLGSDQQGLYTCTRTPRNPSSAVHGSLCLLSRYVCKRLWDRRLGYSMFSHAESPTGHATPIDNPSKDDLAGTSTRPRDKKHTCVTDTYGNSQSDTVAGTCVTE